jgi:hypothetical protein
MRGVLMLAALLAGTAVGGEPRLADLLVPDHADYSLAPYTWPEYRALGAQERLAAKGVDLESWTNPNFRPIQRTLKPGSDAQTRAWFQSHQSWQRRNEMLRHPGFHFDERLAAKRRVFARLLRRGEAGVFLDLVEGRDDFEREWRRFDTDLAKMVRDYEKYGTLRGTAANLFRKDPKRYQEIVNAYPRRIQTAVALRHSDRRFLAWLAKEVGVRLGRLDAATARPFLDSLAEGLKSTSPQHRLWCADLLAWAGEYAALEKAMAAEREAGVLVRMIALRAREKRGLAAALGPHLKSRSWNVRLAVIETLGRTPEAQTMLRPRWINERGRLRGAIDDALGTEPRPVETVDFYGITARTRRALFCIDVSPSMKFPMDGLGGKKPPRFDKTRRELFLALQGLPEAVSFNVLVYNARVTRFKSGLVSATEKNKEAALKFIDGLSFKTGGTNIHQALRECLGGKRKVALADTVFFLTDGEPTVGALVDPYQILEEISELNRGRNVTLHTIGVSDEQDAGFLLNLAHRNGGRFVAHR